MVFNLPDQLPLLFHQFPADVAAGELETQMEVSADAGIPPSVGLELPRTPREPTPTPMTASTGFEPSSASGHVGTALPASGVHGREGASDVEEANRPTKQARIMAVFVHEDDTHLCISRMVSPEITLASWAKFSRTPWQRCTLTSS